MKKLVFAGLAALLVVLMLSACGGEPEPAGEIDPATLELARNVFQANCAACHSATKDIVLVGPSLVEIASRAGDTVTGIGAREYIEESILDPAAYLNEGYQNVMPGSYRTTLSNGEINALVDYLMTLE